MKRDGTGGGKYVAANRKSRTMGTYFKNKHTN